MRARVGSIEDIAWRGWRLRLWCFGCARSRVLDADKVLQLFATRGWDQRLDAARQRFPCRRCRSWKDVIILPARPTPPPPAPAPQPALSWAREVERFFHGMRGKRRDEPLPASAIEMLRCIKNRGPSSRPGPSVDSIDDLA
jgi:hypothetical protein